MESKRRWAWGIGLAVLVVWGLLAARFLLTADRTRPEPVVLWSSDSHGDETPAGIREIRRLEDDLKATLFTVDFQGTPFSECIGIINDKVGSRTDIEPIRFEWGEIDSLKSPIKLKLTDVPLGELLRYTTSLVQYKYRVESGRTIQIVSLDEPERRDEGWFQPGPSFFSVKPGEKGSVDVRTQLEAAGVKFQEDDVADYFPQRELLWVENTRDQMELVEAYLDSAIHCHFEPTWRDYVYELWWRITANWRTPPVSAPASSAPFSRSATASPDPFAAPDPFQ